MQENDLKPVVEIAKETGIPVNELLKLANSFCIVAKKIRDEWYIPLSNIEQLLNKARFAEIDDSSSIQEHSGRIPADVKKSLSGLVKGEYIKTITIDSYQRKLLKVDGKTFKSVFVVNRIYLQNGEYTAPPDENEYIESSNYLTEDGLAGFSISPTGWLVSLFSNYTFSGFAASVNSIIREKASKLVCIVSDSLEENRLVKHYKECFGFRVYARTTDDTEIMTIYYGREFISNFISRHGKPFHVFMVSELAKTVNEEIAVFNDYFKAEEFVERTVLVGQGE